VGGLLGGHARVPLTNMGQTLFEPPNVAGWQLGARGSAPGAMLAAHESRRDGGVEPEVQPGAVVSAAERAQAAGCSTHAAAVVPAPLAGTS